MKQNNLFKPYFFFFQKYKIKIGTHSPKQCAFKNSLRKQVYLMISNFN